MNNETREKLIFWLSQHPDSSHPRDEERFISFVKAMIRNQDNVSADEIIATVRQMHNWADSKIFDLVPKWILRIETIVLHNRFVFDNY